MRLPCGIFLVAISLFALAFPARAFEATTTRAAKAEILKGERIIGSLVIPVGTRINATYAPDNKLKAYFNGMVVRISMEDIKTQLPPPPPPPPPMFDRLQTKTGEVYEEVTIVERNPAEIKIRHASGRATLRIDQLDADIQKLLDYDPVAAAEYCSRKAADAARKAEAEQEKRDRQAQEADARAKAAASSDAGPPVPPAPQDPSDADDGSSIFKECWNALIAKAPVRLYAANIDPKFLDSKSGEYGKGAVPGEPFAEVPSGYLVICSHWRDSIGGLVRLPSPIGPHRFAYVYRSDFAHIGVASWRKWWDETAVSADVVPDLTNPRLQALKVGARTQLNDVFNKRSVVVTNRTGGFLKAYKLLECRTGVETGFGLVQTSSGWFFGYPVEMPEAPAIEMDWVELTREKAKPFHLELQRSVELKKGTALFRLADFTGPNRQMTPRTDPRQVRVMPKHYGTLLNFGLPGLLADFDSLLSDPVKILAANSPDPDGSGGIEKQMQIRELALKFTAWSSERTLIELIVTQDEREIERTTSKNEGSSAKAGPWKTVKKTSGQWIENDKNGGLRLTDGREIFDISVVGPLQKLELHNYSVIESSLTKQAE